MDRSAPTRRPGWLLLVAILALVARRAEAQDAAAPPEPAPAAEAPEAVAAHPPERPEPVAPTPRPPIGLKLGVEVSSMYVFRGLNVFQDDNQLDQHPLFAPAVSYTIPRTGLTFGYWGAFGLTPENAAELIDRALGHEQDLIATYAWPLVPDTLTLTAGLIWYFYPFADEAETGAAFTSYLEPGVDLAYTGPVTLTLKVAYFIGLADALWPHSYVYFRPRISRAIELGSVVSFNFGLGFGYKQFTDPDGIVVQNRFDVQLDWELPIRATEHLTVTPAMHLAWTDLADRPVDREFAIWGGVVIGIGI